jgi:hypothetical protein
MIQQRSLPHAPLAHQIHRTEPGQLTMREGKGVIPAKDRLIRPQRVAGTKQPPAKAGGFE